MINTYSNKQLKTNTERRVNRTLILGVVSGIMFILAYYSTQWLVVMGIFVFPVPLLLALIGIIIGIIEWKSTKKKTTLFLGIILCTAMLIFSLKYMIILWWVIKAISQ